MAEVTEWAELDEFYDARPERRFSGESDYGVHWHNGRVSWPTWRVSYIQATGELYAYRAGGPVKLLGVFPPDEEGCYYATLDKLLAGWADQPVCRLSWLKGRLNDKARIEEIVNPQPTPKTAADAVRPFRGSGGGWTHDDPAGVCTTTAKRHKQEHTARTCEYNSQLIAWKRRKAARRAAAR